MASPSGRRCCDGTFAELLRLALRFLRIRRTARLALEYAGTSAALFQAELGEEGRRLARLALATALGLFFLFLTLLFAELLILALAWDGPRRLAVGLGLAGFDLTILLALALWAWRLARLKARRFRHSRAEWQRNLEWVRQKLS